MSFLSSLMLSHFCPFSILTTATTRTFHQLSYTSFSSRDASLPHNKSVHHISLFQAMTVGHDGEMKECDIKEEEKIKWTNVALEITEDQKKAISKLSPKMSNRCKALMERIICFSSKDESFPLLLAAWVKAMKPRRADWLSVLKEMTRIENPFLMEVMEYALLEDSFEANIRDYTKLIHIYGKHNLLQHAEDALQAMKSRGFPCDQVILTVLIHMYSKSGDLNRAKQAFEEIKLLGLHLDKRAYGSMIMSYIRANMLEYAERLLKEMEAQEIYAGKEVYKALLRAYSTIGNSNGAQRIFDAIQFAGIVPDGKFCALLVNAYCVAGQSEKARSVLENMRSARMKPSDKCIALMLGAYEKENNLKRALSFLLELEEDGIIIAQEASQVLAGWFHRLGVVDEVEQVLREFSDNGRETALSRMIRVI
ncbi:pentatricopeptide repeat-containing protein At1g01970 [Typha latifolia]|uniref:pentatricopeptide repeat-containing protein At1g01970 n=1 Tax=Typha latifolia TaxID=4733 RepID=UPI003C2EA621